MYTPGGEVSSDDKLWGMLSYLTGGLIGIVILLMEDKKSRPFLKTHGVQSLALGIVEGVLGSILIGITVGFGALCIGPAILIYNIYLAVKTYQGESMTIPVITDFCRKQGWIA